MRLPVALTVAGSDSGGGAGIQADLKTFAALGCHGASALTAVTVQNTLGVRDAFDLPPGLVRSQIDAVVDDLAPQATKTGMLSTSVIIEAVAQAVRERGLDPLVVDPVMVAKGGHRLLAESAVASLRDQLLPLATVITPNLPEAEVLLGRPLATRPEREAAARELVGLGCRAAVVKGGHAEGDADDVLYDGERVVWLPGERIDTGNTHGSGCTFASAIAAGLAHGLPLEAAVRAGKRFVAGAIRRSLQMGGGHGPVNPLWELLPPGPSAD